MVKTTNQTTIPTSGMAWFDVEALRQVKAPFFYGRFGGAAALAARQMEHLVGLWIYSTTQKVMNSESSLL